MFGHQEHDETNHTNPALPTAEPKEDATLSATPQDTVPPVGEQLLPATNPDDHATDDGSTDDDASDFILTDAPKPHSDAAAPATPSPHVGPQPDELLDIKQNALQQLSPLVGHLDQSPEERFRTTMMMIQASDDKSLVKAAYEAAQQISDEKERAQALLDIVNEINYFTQHAGEAA